MSFISSKCGILGRNFYHHKLMSHQSWLFNSSYCTNRATFLEAMKYRTAAVTEHVSINELYTTKSPLSLHARHLPACKYKWFSAAEICMILERFNAITFVGDEHIRAIYIALNTLISEDPFRGGMNADADIECTCEMQLWKVECVGAMLRSSDEASQNLGLR